MCMCVSVCDTVILFTTGYYKVTYQVISYWTSNRSNFLLDQLQVQYSVVPEYTYQFGSL